MIPVVCVGVKLGLLQLRKGHRLRMSENRVLRRIFRTKEEATGGWRKSHNEELHNLYALPRVVKSRRIRWVGHVVRMRTACIILV